MLPGPFGIDIGLYQYTKETAHEYDLYFVGMDGNFGQLSRVTLKLALVLSETILN